MTYWILRSKARPIFGASRQSSVRICSIRGYLALRLESSTFSRASCILRAPRPPHSSHEQELADAPIAWDSNVRSFTSPASLHYGWSGVPQQPSMSMTTAAVYKVCKPSGVTGLPLINSRFFSRSRALDVKRYVMSICGPRFSHLLTVGKITTPLLNAFVECDSAVETDACFHGRSRTKTGARRPKVFNGVQEPIIGLLHLAVVAKVDSIPG